MSEEFVVLEIPTSEKPFFESLVNKGNPVEVIEAERWDGLKEVLDVIVTLTTVTTPIIVAYLNSRKRAKINGTTYENYSPEEIEEILKKERKKRK